MPIPDSTLRIPEQCRRDIFHALVDAQDADPRSSASDSRREVALRFGVNEECVRKIQREGLDKRWPPL